MATSAYLNRNARSLAQAMIDSGAAIPCKPCSGSGKIEVRQNIADDRGGTVREKCPWCGGAGAVYATPSGRSPDGPGGGE